jgi:ribosomal protein S18 acetylase RimI-like enzyme
MPITNASTVVNYLATLPQYNRKGLGKLLIDVCLNAADEFRAKTFLIATPAGSGLYRKLGFREIDRVSWDTVAHGGHGLVTWLCMIRQADSSGVNCSATAM